MIPSLDGHPLIKVLLVMNNYFHDVATAVLLASAIIMWVLERRARAEESALIALRDAYPVLTTFARGAIAWIVLGGVPRTIFFAQLEWDPARTRFMLPALGVKHMLMVVAVVAGVLLWRRAKGLLPDG